MPLDGPYPQVPSRCFLRILKVYAAAVLRFWAHNALLTKLFNHFNPRPKATVTEQDGPIVENARLPTYDELPKFKDFAGCAWAVWGEDDELGTVNLLTPDVVQRAAKEEIITGHAISLNWPLNFPEKPLFKRKAPQVKTIAHDDTHVRRDDEIHIVRLFPLLLGYLIQELLSKNTQSGTQWDGMRHFGLIEHGVYYN
ncbi:hypothetical protein H0H93_014849, partial [Arthromyces matolae]